MSRQTVMATRLQMEQIARMTAAHYKQQAIFMYRVSDTAVLVDFT
jgi:hypothetical protein